MCKRERVLIEIKCILIGTLSLFYLYLYILELLLFLTFLSPTMYVYIYICTLIFNSNFKLDNDLRTVETSFFTVDLCFYTFTYHGVLTTLAYVAIPGFMKQYVLKTPVA